MAQFAIDEILTTGIQISGFIFDRSYGLGTAGQVLTSTSSGVMWQADSSIIDLSALSGQIVSTGALLNNRINSLSGYVNETFVSGSGTQYYVPRWNTSKELVTGSIYDNGFVGIGITNPSGQLHLRNMGFTNQSGIADSNTFPNATGVFGLVMDHNAYTNGLYRHRFIKVDRSSNLPLYLQQAGGVANQYINLVRFGTHSQSTNTFEVFGDSKINGTTDITSNLLVAGNVGIGSNAPTDFLDFGGVGGKNIVFNYAAYGEGRNSLASIIGNNVKASPTGHSLVRRFKNATDEGNFIKLIYNKGVTFHTNITSALNTDISEDTNERMRINLSGNVGVGTTNPTVRLHVIGSSIITNPSPSANSAVLLVQDNGTATTVTSGATLRVVNDGSSANYSVFEASSAVSNFVILNNGNIGIGTTNPAVKLHIENSGTISSIATVRLVGSTGNNAGSQIEFYKAQTPKAAIGLASAVTGGLSDDLLLLSTNPNSIVLVAGLSGLAEDTIKTDGSLVVAVNATFAGNVGIGLTNPAVKLDVSGGNARFSDYIIIGEDLAYPSNTGSAYLGYSTSPASSPQSNLELIDALSNAIGVNDPLRFRATISGQYFSGNNWYADPAPLSYGTLLNGNANSYLDLVTSSEYSVGISGKRFVVDQGTSYTRPNFILLNTDWNQSFWGFKLNVENSNDLINWTNCITEQAFSTNNTKGTIALSIANSIQGGGASRYFRFSFVANQIISAGALRVNKIRSLGNQNYSSTIPVSTSVAGNLIASVGIISPTITSLSGNLAATGSVLDTKINTLSGYSNSTFATITNLAATGSTLDTKINTLSGYANSTFLSGVGVSNYVPRWSGTKLLVTGSIYDLGTGIGIGTISPGTKLDVVGAVTMPVIRQSTTLYAGTDIIDDNSTRTVYFNIPEGGNNPARYFKVARIKINANYQNVSLNGYFTTTNSALHVGFERKVEFDFIAYAATNPGAPQVTYLKRGPDTTNVLVYAVPDGGGAGTTYYDVYIKNGWYNDTNGELAIRVGYSSAVTVWQAGLDSGTSAPVDTLVNPNSNYAFDTAGNVGVGTTNPTVKLHVVGNGLLTNTSAIDLRIDASSLGNASLTIDRQTTAAESKILLLDANISQWGIAAKALSNNFVIRDADSTERFTILKTNGNIGIGTTNPITKFHVYEATNGNNWGLFAGNVGATLPSAYTYGVLIGSNYSNGFSESNIVWGNGISSNQYFAIGRGSGSGFYSEQLRIDVNGDVGIGNTNPTTLLSVGSAGSTSAASGITFGGDSTANLYRSAAGTLKTDGRLNIVGDADDSTPDLFFNGAGGFGSAAGQVRAWSPNNTTLSWYWDNTQFTYNNFPVRVVNASSVVRVYFAPSSDSYINNASNFGIGTNAPGTRLDVRFPTNPATDNGAGNNVLRVWTTAGYAADVGGAIGLGGEYSGGLLQSFGQIAGRKSNGISGNNAGYLQFATTNNGGTMSEWMRIDAGGNVGIGTTNPVTLLTVGSTTTTTSSMTLQGEYQSSTFNNTNIFNFRHGGFDRWRLLTTQNSAASNDFDFSINAINAAANGYNTFLTIKGLNGNVGIGTNVTPLKLNVSGSIYMAAGSGSAISWANDISSQFLKYDSVTDGMVLSSWNNTTFLTQQTERVRIASNGNVGIGITAPTSKLNVVETTPTGTRIQLGANTVSAYMDANKTVDLLILNAPYGGNPATTSNLGAKWGIKFVGSLESNQIDTIGKTSAIYAVSEDALGYNRGTSLAFYTNQLNDVVYAERMRIYHNGNIGIGITNPSNKLHISGGGISFTTSTGLAVPMIGIVLPTNIAYIGPYTTTTDGNAPTTVVFNQGASVQQSWFYSSGRIAMVLNKEGRLNIAGNLSNTPPALLNVGPASSVDAVSGMSFGNDSSANLYRSAASTIKTDGSLVVVGAATLGPININGGTLGASPVNIALTGFTYAVNNGNVSQITFVEKRFATGGDWTTATTRIQKRVDVTDQAYIEFNPSGALYGMALGVGANSNVEALRILSNGNVGIGTVSPVTKLHIEQIQNAESLITLRNNRQDLADVPIFGISAQNGITDVAKISFYRGGGGNAGYLTFSTKADNASSLTEKVRIDGSGNVGIGQTNPLSKFVVSGGTVNTTTYTTSEARIADGSLHLMKTVAGGIFESIRAMNMDTTAGTTVRVLAASTSDPFNNGNGGKVFIDAIRTATNMDLAFSLNDVAGAAAVERVRFMGNGNVGIGTAIPSSPLHVFNTSATLATFTRDLATDAGFAIGADNNGTVLSTIGVHAIQIYTNNTEKARITSDGKLGIGTNTPTTLLSVGGAGSTTAASGITFGGDAQTNIYRFVEDTLKTDGALIAGGYLRTLSYVQLVTDLYPGSYTDNLNLNIGNTAGNAWETAIKIKPGSYVGIGTTQPSGKLHVVSSIAGETVLRADGTNGTLFSVVDDLSDSLMSVNNSAGLPVLEVFADDRIVAGQYGSGDLVIRNNKVGIGNTNPSFKVDVNGSLGINASTSDTNWPFVVSDNSSAGSRYGLNKAGSMGFNYADAYAQLQLLGTNGAYIDFANSVGGDSNARLIYYAGARLDLTYGFAPKSTISVTPNAIGIGTTNPLWALDVSRTAVRSFASGAVEPGFIADYASSNGYGGFFVHTNGVRKWRIAVVGDTNTSPALSIWQEGIGSRMHFRNNGAVGVGTTIPDTKLSIGVASDSALGSTSDGLKITDGTRNVQLLRNGTGYNYAGVVGSGSMLYSYDRMHIVADTSNPILFHTNGAERVRIGPDGNVGIGTTAPTNKLQVVGQIAIKGDESADNAKMYFQASDNSNRYTVETDLDGNTNNDLLIFRSNTVDNMLVLKGNGNVGIGTTNPAHKLEVFNTANSQTYVRVNNQDTGGSAYAGLDLQSYGGGWQVRVPASTTFVNPLIFSFNEAERARITSAGNVGIGLTVPTDKIQISGGGISLTTSTGLAVPMLGMTPLNIAYVGPYNTPTDGNAPSTVLFNHGASVQQTWFYSSGSIAMVLNRQGRLHIGNNNNAPNCLLSVGPSSSTTAVSGMCFGNDAQANLYRSAEDTIKTDGNLVVAGTTSLNGHIYGQKTVALSTASWTTVLTVNMLAHNSCYVKIGAFGDWGNHSAVAFVSELFIQNGDNAYNTPGTIITAHDNTGGAAGDKIDIQIVDPAAVGTQNFLIQLKLISATSSTNSSLITYHVMGQQASVT